MKIVCSLVKRRFLSFPVMLINGAFDSLLGKMKSNVSSCSFRNFTLIKLGQSRHNYEFLNPFRCLCKHLNFNIGFFNSLVLFMVNLRKGDARSAYLQGNISYKGPGRCSRHYLPSKLIAVPL